MRYVSVQSIINASDKLRRERKLVTPTTLAKEIGCDRYAVAGLVNTIRGLRARTGCYSRFLQTVEQYRAAAFHLESMGKKPSVRGIAKFLDFKFNRVNMFFLRHPEYLRQFRIVRERKPCKKVTVERRPSLHIETEGKIV